MLFPSLFSSANPFNNPCNPSKPSFLRVLLSTNPKAPSSSAVATLNPPMSQDLPSALKSLEVTLPKALNSFSPPAETSMLLANNKSSAPIRTLTAELWKPSELLRKPSEETHSFPPTNKKGYVCTGGFLFF